ncbi:sigma-70 family RNA polymerase sigma factor [Sphingobacterium sp. DN00404]|uniref:Sigma-70 family RNA polymerase sigma factor n=1 Tax=Sphingobacterium micropteri TaxID=2763501 RepID=A0ABR7YJS2_9SPHI|nr:sigma-70 family RNA polymerase sigma factor [Sphingobacterium micropteri]MBD1431540.1 sigma-70 family RNA polymerase sigma factor [Sphingobacterium micropteri]
MHHSDPKIDCFNHIYKLYWKELYYFTLKKVKDHALAEDLLHDVFLKLLKSDDLDNRLDTIKGYLYTALRNRITDHYRKNKRQLDLEQNIPTWYSQHDNKVLEVTIKRELDDFLELQVNRLPDQMRRVVQLNSKEGFSTPEIAQKLLISDKTVRNQLSLANQKLRSAIEKFLR